MDVLDEPAATPVPAPSRIERRALPPPEALAELADLLAATDPERLALVVGDEVAASGAVDAMITVSETLGAAVYGSPLHSNLNFPPGHPLWAGMLAPTAAAIASTLSAYQRVLLVGGQAFLVYPFSPGPALPEGVELVHLSPDPAWLGRTYPTRLGLVGDPRVTLETLVPLLRERVDNGRATARLEVAAAARRRTADGFEETALARYEDVPMDPMAAGHALVRALPPDSIVVDEAITTGFYVRGFHHPARPGTYFFCRGGGLGWGMPAACGVALGRGEPVLCVVGDGSAMYSPQALWTAAHERLPVVFAVVNNREYAILRQNLAGRGGDAARTGNFVGMKVDEPPVDFCALARSMGVAATLVEKAPDVGDAVRQALSSGAPHLLELPIASR
jgi:benzoylformate decarboxylase